MVCARANIVQACAHPISGSVSNCGTAALTGVNVTDTVTNAGGAVTVVTILSNATIQIGRASWRERVKISVVAVSLKKNFVNVSGDGPWCVTSSRLERCTV